MYAAVKERKKDISTSIFNQVIQLPISSWEDVRDSDYNLIVWRNGVVEDMLRESPKGSAMRQIYEKKLLNQPEELHLNRMGYDESINHVLDSSSVLYTLIGPYLLMEGYPCDFVEVQQLK